MDEELTRPRELLRPCLLLLLAETPGHGYDLMARLKPFGFDWGGPGPIYRELRALEDAGTVRSRWEAPGAGPARHVYELTHAGLATLERWAADLQGLARLLDEYHERYEAVAVGAADGDTDDDADADTAERSPAERPPPAGGAGRSGDGPPGGRSKGGGRMRLRRR